MADIELIIKVPEESYNFLKSGYFIDDGTRSGKTILQHFCRAIYKGKPLPKGHGRLKDVDYGLKNCKDEHEIEYWDKEVPTIIEADKESEE